MKAECGQAHPQNALHSMSRNWVLNNDNMVPARNKTDTLEEHPPENIPFAHAQWSQD